MTPYLTFEFETPPSWLVCRLDRPDAFPPVAGQVATRLKERKDLRPFRDIMIDAAESFARDAREHGSLMSAVRFDLTRDRAQTALFAYLEVQGRRLEGSGRGPERLARLAETVSQPQPGDEVAPMVEVVELKTGPAVRCEYVRAHPRRGTLRMAVEYWIPVGDTGQAALLQFSHANLAATAVFAPEYQFIADHFVVQGDP